MFIVADRKLLRAHYTRWVVMPARQGYSVTLHRDGASQPWGIRLVGGCDLDKPIVITRVSSIKLFLVLAILCKYYYYYLSRVNNWARWPSEGIWARNLRTLHCLQRFLVGNTVRHWTLCCKRHLQEILLLLYYREQRLRSMEACIIINALSLLLSQNRLFLNLETRLEKLNGELVLNSKPPTYENTLLPNLLSSSIESAF